MRHPLRNGLLLLLTARSVAHAQTSLGEPAADSAAVARGAWARAAAALGARDSAAAVREAAHAAAAWPTQPAYVWGRAVLAAQAGDTAAVRDALAHFAALGVSRDLRADRRFAAYVSRPDFAAVLARLDTNGAPLARSTVRATLPDSTFWPEGMDHDARTGRFYVASVRHGTIAEVDARGRVRELLPRDRPGFGAVLGVRVDARRNALWATLAGIPQYAPYVKADSLVAALVRIRLADGAIERRWDLPPSPKGHTLGDLAVGAAGDVWVTDSNEPVLYRLRPGADTLERRTHPLFYSLQGVAPTPDGRVVYVADYAHGLLRVDVATGHVTRLADAPGSTSLGCDGIAWDRGAIVAVQNGVTPPRVVRLVLDPAGTRVVRVEVLDRHVPLADEPTIGAVVGGEFVYVANSQWEKHDDAGVPNAGARLAKPVLLAVPLPRR
jgi:sugar lactone lactonase YvrE